MPNRNINDLDELDIERFWKKVNKTDGCWLWQGATSRSSQGYGAFSVGRSSIPKGLFILHHCDNPPCVRPDHLFIGTQKDNINDMIKKGRFNVSRGEEKPITSKLTETQVLAIRLCYAEDNMTMQDIADRYNMSLRGIFGVLRGMAWKYVGGPILSGTAYRQHQVHKRKPTQRGELVGSSKLTWDIVHQVRTRKGQTSAGKMAKEFGVCATTMERVLSNKTWLEPPTS